MKKIDLADDREVSLDTGGRWAILVSVLTMVSRCLGFLRMATITYVYGAGGQADVINLIFNIPNNLRKLLAEGALSAAFIPTLTSVARVEGGAGRARRLVGNLFGLQLAVLLPLSLLAVTGADSLVNGILTGFTRPDQLDLAASLLRYLFHYTILVSLSAVIMGVLNTHNCFLRPAATPLLFSVCVIGSIWLLHSVLGPYALVVGVLGGGLAQILWQAPQFYRHGYVFKVSFHFSDPDFRQVIRLWLPVLLIFGLFTVNQMVAFRLASGLTSGSVSALTNGLVFWQLPLGLFSSALGTVIFPRLSRQQARGDSDGLRESLRYGMRFLLVFLIPSAVVLVCFGRQIIAVAIGRGRFTWQNTQVTAQVLAAYSAGLFFVALHNLLQRFFFARQIFSPPLVVTLAICAIDIALSLWLKETGLAVSGLAVAASSAYAVGSLALLVQASRSLGGLRLPDLLPFLLKLFLTAGVLAAWLLFYAFVTGDWWRQGSSLINLLRLTGALLPAGLLVVVLYYGLGIDLPFALFKNRRKKNG